MIASEAPELFEKDLVGFCGLLERLIAFDKEGEEVYNCVLLKHVLLLQTCEVSIDTLWVAIE